MSVSQAEKLAPVALSPHTAKWWFYQGFMREQKELFFLVKYNVHISLRKAEFYPRGSSLESPLIRGEVVHTLTTTLTSIFQDHDCCWGPGDSCQCLLIYIKMPCGAVTSPPFLIISMPQFLWKKTWRPELELHLSLDMLHHETIVAEMYSPASGSPTSSATFSPEHNPEVPTHLNFWVTEKK